MSPGSTEATAPLRVVIVDDEPLARLRLRSLVEANPAPRAVVVGEAADAASAQQLLHTTACDLVLLDIAMPSGNGLKLADDLRRDDRLASMPKVVFVTAHAEHALRAFEQDAGAGLAHGQQALRAVAAHAGQDDADGIAAGHRRRRTTFRGEEEEEGEEEGINSKTSRAKKSSSWENFVNNNKERVK